MIANSIQLRQMNTELIRSELKRAGSATKNSISAATGLSVATCGNILAELLRSGEVKEIETADSTGGRPSRQFTYNEKFAYVLALYLRKEGNSRFIYVAVVNMVGEIVREETHSFDSIGLKEVYSVIERSLDSFPRIEVIGIGIPGVVNNGIIGQCDFAELCNTPVVASLRERFQRQIVAENDVNCTALGFYRGRTDHDTESIVYIYYPEDGNAGAGIVVNGTVLRGYTNFAGEVSCLPLGVGHEEQRRIQADARRFADYIAKTVLTVNAVVNPEKVVLSGSRLNEEVRELLTRAVAAESVDGHAPFLFFEEDIHDSYVNGLKYLALKKMSCEFEIVKK